VLQVWAALFVPVVAAEIGEQEVEAAERRACGKSNFDISANALMKSNSSFPMGMASLLRLQHYILLCQRTGPWPD
jgi:hypothetical protein